MTCEDGGREQRDDQCSEATGLCCGSSHRATDVVCKMNPLPVRLLRLSDILYSTLVLRDPVQGPPILVIVGDTGEGASSAANGENQ
jgi:hypothetical protein